MWVVSAVAMSVGGPRILAWMVRRGVGAGIGLAVWASLVCTTLLVVGAPVLAEAVSRCADLLGAGDRVTVTYQDMKGTLKATTVELLSKGSMK